MLLETPIRAGDVLSLQDIQTARSHLESALPPDVVPDGARLAFEPLLTTDPPVLRAWVIEDAAAVDFASLDSLELEPSGAAVTVRGTLDETGSSALSEVSAAAEGKALVFVLGRDVLAAPVVGEPLTDGRFGLTVAKRGDDDEALGERLERLADAPSLSVGLTLDLVATADAERDNKCYAPDAGLATCGCVEGRCEWRESEALAACIESGELVPTATPK